MDTRLEDNLEEMLDSISLQNKFKKEMLLKRKIALWGPVHDKSCREITEALWYLENQKPGAPITFYINSPGGVVTSGMIVYDTIQMITSPVKTICIGMAASMGSILLSGGTKGKREIWPNGRVMIHQPSIGGQLFGQATDLQIHATEIKKTKEKSAHILAKNCGKSFEQVMSDFDRDYWMDAKEALEYGIVDTISEKFEG